MSGNSIATRKMKDSGVEWIGEIPEDWGMKKHSRKIP